MTDLQVTQIGEEFHRRVKRKNRRGELRRYAKYRCHCGNEFVSPVYNISSGKTKSCGCKRVAIGDVTRTHGKSRTRTYKIWAGMIKRCRTDPRYSSRGITVCERWMRFEEFFADMGEAPDRLSIDRIDNDGNYCPENCRWATSKQQARNMRVNRLVTVNGKEMTLAEAAENAGQDYRVVHRRLKRGWTLCRALGVELSE